MLYQYIDIDNVLTIKVRNICFINILTLIMFLTIKVRNIII